MSVQSTITTVVYRPVTLTVPTTLTAALDAQLIDDCLDAYYAEMQSAHGIEIPADTLTLFAAAIRDGDAVTVLYTDDKGDTTARTLFPLALMLTKERHIVARAFCTLRRETKCFRLDRMTGAHLVTLPSEAHPVAPVAPVPAYRPVTDTPWITIYTETA